MGGTWTSRLLQVSSILCLPLISGRGICVRAPTVILIYTTGSVICYHNIGDMSEESLVVVTWTSCHLQVFYSFPAFKIWEGDNCLCSSCHSELVNHLCPLAALIDVDCLPEGSSTSKFPSKGPSGMIQFTVFLLWWLEIISYDPQLTCILYSIK